MSEADIDVDATASVRDDAFLEDLHRQMLKFATLQLGDAHLAEDAVQDALMGALKDGQALVGRGYPHLPQQRSANAIQNEPVVFEDRRQE
jgi:DNA-directed RNA polymerase specialized sigma24 family protein